MRKFKVFASYLLSATFLLGVTSCDNDTDFEGDNTPANAPYVVCLGITSNSATSYYIVPVSDFMNGTISASGNQGIEQNGYRSFQIGNNSIFSIGGLGLTDANIITKGADGKLQQKSSFVFEQSLSGIEQADSENMVAVDIPTSPTGGNQFKMYLLNINSGAITKKVTKPVNELSTSDWPRLTGMTVSDNKIYITYYLTDETQKPSVTRYIDKAYVAVYSYPELEYITTMEDERAAIAGSWNAYNGIFQTESGDMYTFSNTSIANGFTENSTKKAAFLHIPKGTTQFDDYYFDVETAAGGLKPVHLQYLGNGKFFAQVSTLQSEEMTRWADKELKACIIDVKEKTVKDIPQIPVHDGDGGQRMSGVIENGYFYIPLATDGALYFYKVDINNATAERGAKVASNFVSGTFKMN